MPTTRVVTRRLRPAEGASRPSRAEAERAPLLAPIPQARGVGQLLDATVTHYREHFVALTTVALLIAFPFQLAVYAVAHSGLTNVGAPFHELLWALLTEPARIVVSAFAFGIVGGALSGRPRGPLEAAGVALAKLPALIFVFFLSSLVAVMTCGIGGVLAPWLVGPAIGLIVLEGVTVNKVVPRTIDLALGWGSLGRWMGMYVVTSVVLGGLGAVNAALNAPELRGTVVANTPLGSGAFDLLLPVLGATLMALQMAVNGVSMVVFYLDLRVRRGGLDLSRRLDRLEAARSRRVFA